MVSFEQVRDLILRFPDTIETMSWDARSFKVNKKVILYWNPTYDCPVFKLSFEERDFLLEVDPETFFTTDHHRPWPMILGRPDKLEMEWVARNIEQVWRAQVSKKTLKAFDAGVVGWKALL